MKTGLLFFLMFTIASSNSLSAQSPKIPGDTIDIWTVIDFEESTPYIQLSPSMQDIWQIGKPQKSFLNSAFTVPNAIITDSINQYPPNNLSWFDLYIGAFNMGEPWYFSYPDDIFIDIRHRYDTDTLADGGYITVSWDKGQTWMNVINDSVYPGEHPQWEYGPWGGNSNLYSNDQTLVNGEPGFSGNSGGWIHTFMNWFVWPVKSALDFPPDTMILRFNFVSDGNDNNREGWLIDHIRIFSLDLGSGISDAPGKARSHLNPNPVKTYTSITLDREYPEVAYEVVNIAGKVCFSALPGRCRAFNIDCRNLSKGIYTIRISFGDHHSPETIRMIKIE